MEAKHRKRVMGTRPPPQPTMGESSTPLNCPTTTPLPRGGVLQRSPANSLTSFRTCAHASPVLGSIVETAKAKVRMTVFRTLGIVPSPVADFGTYSLAS